MDSVHTVTPFGPDAGSKKVQVAQMFDQISGRYDLLNRLMSMGIDQLWRRRAIRMLAPCKPKTVVDLATGTGDFAIEALKLKPKRIIGLDISEGMLAIGREKMKKRGLSQLIEMRQADAEALPLADGEADAITVGFGVRNFEDLDLGLREMHRVLRVGGQAVILEPAAPTAFPLKQLFLFYFRYITPLLGRLLSSRAAYEYLPASVAAFPNGQDFVNRCLKAGFRQAHYVPLTFGICSLYWLEK